MAHVWDAMKKHQAEQAAKVAAGPDAPAAPVADTMPRASAELPRPLRDASATALRLPPELVVHHDRGSAAAEKYRALRANLLGRYPDGRFCLLVTSAESGEGKTVTCLNLALALTRIFHKCYAAARRGGRLAGKVAAEAGITASARNPPLPP